MANLITRAARGWAAQLTPNALTVTGRRPVARALWPLDGGGLDYSNSSQQFQDIARTPAQRRARRTNADITVTHAAVHAATRIRSQRTRKGVFHLMRRRGGEALEVMEHPALEALHRINSTLTARQGIVYTAQRKLTFGRCFWVKRRNPLGVVVDFELWDPERVEIVPTKPGGDIVSEFKLYNYDGSASTIGPEDMIYFRHFLDPRNPMYALGPVGAVRIQADTGLEALRYNQRFFDNDAMPRQIISAVGAAAGQAKRIEDVLREQFRSTDNAWGTMVAEGELKTVSTPMPHKDMQFLEMMGWDRTEVASVFEMAPYFLGDTEQSTKANAENYERGLWEVVVTDAENMTDELNEFWIWPDFGREFFLTVTFDTVAALQADKLRQAEIDELELKSAKVVINELRDRDGENPVAWGDTPIVSSTLAPLDTRTPEEKAAAAPSFAPAGNPDDNDDPERMPPNRAMQRAIEDIENDMASGWEVRLRRELRALITHLDAADRRAFGPGDVDSFDWDWWHKYGDQVIRELAEAMEESLSGAGYTSTALDPTHELAVRYAEGRGAELLQLEGPANVVALTRKRVATLVAETLESGDSLRTLKNRLRQDFSFSPSRAETIARTETATAQGKGSLMSYAANGFEGKRWITAGDDLVDAQGRSTPCLDNESDGIIPLSQPFSSGQDTVPAHPRCRCTIAPAAFLDDEII